MLAAAARNQMIGRRAGSADVLTVPRHFTLSEHLNEVPLVTVRCARVIGTRRHLVGRMYTTC
jgi:hypothetical protein